MNQSETPPSETLNSTSPSAMHGESTTLFILKLINLIKVN